MAPEVRAFVDSYRRKPLPLITVKNFKKFYNHEIWRKCNHCKNEWDARKESDGTKCPKCGEEGTVK